MAKNPKYIEIANYFIQKIENEELKENEPLDPEEQLCAQFNVSHMTMAKAMNELSAEGYIKRITGKGTFISGNYRTSFKKPISSRNSITAQIQEAGLESRIELYKYSIIRGKDDPEVAAKLHISEDEFLHFFIRLRYANDNLMAISYTYIVQKAIPTLDIHKLEGSLNKYIKELGIERTDGSTEFCATMPNKENAKILGTDHIPLLKQPLRWNADDKPFELTYHYFIGTKYSITSDLHIIHNKKIVT